MSKNSAKNFYDFIDEYNAIMQVEVHETEEALTLLRKINKLMAEEQLMQEQAAQSAYDNEM